jgi:hypothetical protein
MSAIVTSKFRLSNAINFKDSFSVDSHYLFIGRSESWPDDNIPPTPTDTIISDHAIHRDMITAKSLGPNDVTHVVPRRDWITGTIYDMYHHAVTSSNPSSSSATSLWESRFYVMNSDYNVYMCLSNNGGIASVDSPTGVSTATIQTSDGYRWKYLYNISTSNVQKYLSIDFMPVYSDVTVTAACLGYLGSVEFVKLISSGSGYTNGTHPAIPIQGDGTGGTAQVVVVNGMVSTTTMSANGSGYTYASIDLTPIEDSGVTTISANLEPIISPSYGHGGDNVNELGSYFIMINTILTGQETDDFLVNQDFRQIGIIKNPTNYGTVTVSSAVTLSGLKSLIVTGFGTTHFAIDEVITGTNSGAIARVASFDSATGVIKYIQQSEVGHGLSTVSPTGNIYDFQINEAITGSTSTATGTISSLGNPEIKKGSGDILYIEHRMPIPRATDQQENIKLIVEF